MIDDANLTAGQEQKGSDANEHDNDQDPVALDEGLSRVLTTLDDVRAVAEIIARIERQRPEIEALTERLQGGVASDRAENAAGTASDLPERAPEATTNKKSESWWVAVLEGRLLMLAGVTDDLRSLERTSARLESVRPSIETLVEGLREATAAVRAEEAREGAGDRGTT